MITLAKLNDTHTEQGTRLPSAGPALPSHRAGLQCNDLNTLHSQMIIMAIRGHISLWLPELVNRDGSTLIPSSRVPEDHRGCTHN